MDTKGAVAWNKMACVKCNKSILSGVIHYIVANLGPELLSIIEQDMDHDITPDASLCEACFNRFINLLENTCETKVIQQNSIEPYNTYVCVWCLMSVTKKRTHYLTSGPQRDVISDVIAPRQIPNGGVVCHGCWVHVCRLLDVPAANSGQSQHICVCCKYSLSQRRSHSIPQGPERDVIAAQIAPRQILPGERVCYACWVSARRRVQRASNHNLPIDSGNVCVACSTSTVRRRTHLLPTGPVRDVISRRICPRQVSSHSLVCDDCWTWAQDAVRRESINEEEPPLVLDKPRYIELHTYRKVGLSSAKCFVPGCTYTERLTVPGYFRKNMLSKYKIYIGENARVCLVHKTTVDWDHVFDLERLSSVFSAAEIEKMMEMQEIDSTNLTSRTVPRQQ